MSHETPEILFRASAAPDLVVLVLDPATADQLADVWEFAHKTSGGLDPPARPTFLLDVAALRRAAHQAATAPAPVEYVPVGVPDRPHLSVVGGESR